MSEQQPAPRRIVPAEEGRHLPVWKLESFAAGMPQGAPRLRPQTEEEKRAIQQALAAAQQEAERRAREAVTAQAATQAAPAAGPAEPQPAVDPAEVERIKTAAFDEGYAAGYDQGSAAARREAEQLRQAALAASDVFARFETELAPRLIDLAVEIARQVIRRELAQESHAVLAVVRDAFDQLTGGETGRQLLLHPADVQLVRAHLGEELELGQWKIVEDSAMAPGGCRIATQQSDIDATLPTRWKRTLAALGQDAPWDDAHA
ncbi:Flagellar assembly protein FliH [Pigmentiphaga humi]|uniref:Flagellar assembly protein FliH n=1 Tax=Pigmentiphaga humi TaxID=2478468 RepID=A0A3P4B457_9BURK|nr:flagellar assembly protein FliH [Pigmentiphaga humi]VCU69935.1 Flagellar assembly protein FliH [Pigmentiphaga humi]